MRHPNEERLNDYVDGLLSETERLDVLRHLDDCEECRRVVDRTRDLVAAAGELGDVEPPRDLFPSIRTATAVSPAVATPGPAWLRWGAAAAVVALVGFLAVLRFGGDGRPDPAVSGGDPTIESLLADVRAAEAEYVRATETLKAAIDSRRDEIDPETLAVLDRNLAVIDGAIAEVRLALERDGADFENSTMLTSLYHKKLNVLLSASRLSS